MNKLSRNEINQYWDYRTDRLIPQSLLNDVSKFHQSSTWLKKGNNIPYYPLEVFNWLEENEYIDMVPNYYEYEIEFENIEKINFKNSERNYYLDFSIKKDELGQILYNAFGRSINNPSKRYPSGGGLYSVIPLVYIFNENIIEGTIIKPGCYLYDSTEANLKCIQEWNDEQLKEVVSLVNSYDEKVLSNIAIGYAIDFKRAIAKYNRRGYRHALIEIGVMAQSFRESLKENQGYGEVCWSGFDDNALTYNSGLNVQLSPVCLIQWFGKPKKE